MIIVYVTTSSKEEASKIAHYLLESKLIACANLFPINSVYRWEGEIKEDAEFVLLLKTIDKNYDQIVKEISKLHSYSVPCILKMDVKSNEVYEKWVDGELK